MKSNICPISEDVQLSSLILREVDKCADYNDLSAAQTLKLELLAEELIGMLPNLSRGYTGEFWVENQGKAYELHVSFRADALTVEEHDRLLTVAKSGKNAAATGIIGRIRAAFDSMVASSAVQGTLPHETAAYGLLDATDYTNYTYTWSMERYIETVENSIHREKENAWDELEKSVIAKLADDVIVGIRGSRVDIIVKKQF